ncbi:MAG: dihydrofolate reductase family protein [Candidatus Acidiferrum sp.]
MRRIRYSVVMSLDGYIAGPKGEADWITKDPEFDFAALFSQFDTILVGRRTFDGMVTAGRTSMPGMKTIVFSRTLRQEDHPEVAIVRDGQREALAALKAGPGKDIWLFGGGLLFRSLAEDGLVDTVEVRIVPVLLGAGVPLLPNLERRIKLSLTAQRVYRRGVVSLEYAIT